VAGLAVAAEQPPVRVLVGVAAGTIQPRGLASRQRPPLPADAFRKTSNAVAEQEAQLAEGMPEAVRRHPLPGRTGVARAGQHGMVHEDGAPLAAQMLDVAPRAGADPRMEGRRGARHQLRGIRRVAGQAGGCLGAAQRDVAGFALLAEEGVRGRERTGRRGGGPTGHGARTAAQEEHRHQHRRGEPAGPEGRVEQRTRLHGASHRRP